MPSDVGSEHFACTELILAINEPRTLDGLVPLLDAPAPRRRFDTDPAGNIAYQLAAAGQPGIARLRAAIVNGNEAACSRAVGSLLARVVGPDADTVGPGVRVAAFDALALALHHPAWRCRQLAVAALGEDRSYWPALEPIRTDPAFPVRDVVDAVLGEQPQSATWARLGTRGPTLERLMRKGATHGCWSPSYAQVRLADNLATTERYNALHRDFDRVVYKPPHPSCRRAAMVVMINLDPWYHSRLASDPFAPDIPTDVLRDGRDPAEIPISFEDATPVDAGR